MDMGALGSTGWDCEEEVGGSLDVREQQGCMELYLRTGHESAESLCMRISGKINTSDVVMGVCCRPSDQEENV